ncbi:MAG: taurine catabolism dioxygenase TauD [Saprospiraceae bacterium]|nr:taurine catabolism dioxygenase TauD [Saprospiraceae bacterium]
MRRLNTFFGFLCEFLRKAYFLILNTDYLDNRDLGWSGPAPENPLRSPDFKLGQQSKVDFHDSNQVKQQTKERPPGIKEEEIRPGIIKVPRPLAPMIIEVTPEERKRITRIANYLLKAYKKFDDRIFIDMLHIHAHKLLPERILKILSTFASDFSYTQYGAIIFRGLVDVDQNALGNTPVEFRFSNSDKLAIYNIISFLIHGALRAYPIIQQCQRNGKEGGYSHSIIPTEGKELTQTGEGSEDALWIHTEDSWIYSSAAFMTMFFLRNFERAPSKLYSIRSHDLMKPYIDKLYLKIFKFPMDANLQKTGEKIDEMAESILFGNRLLPFLRFDPVEQLKNPLANQTPEAYEALKLFSNDAKDLIYDKYIPEPGDLILINNRLCCHGRGSFKAGINMVGNIETRCEKRWMIRVLSAASRMEIFQFEQEENGVTEGVVCEKHFGTLYTANEIMNSVNKINKIK